MAAIGHPCPVTSVVYATDGSTITTSTDRTGRVWDTETGEELHTLQGHERRGPGRGVLRRRSRP
ncbi:hypothetical protein [Nocardiopsis sp. L17-MgMaSL7]|uniref:hypothetical protein n=1 Tax=Nocardiopsis sp. L17-MgMaSL7 TaxID=1938893 RepID=UPI000D712CA9|nr:hypothetical protein [Nocardiopsis sp. L17-MgMaSL7]